MKKLGITFAVLAAVALTWNASYCAAASSKEQIIDFEHKCIAATSTDEAMECVDQKDIALYDFVPPLKYDGAQAVRGDFDNFFNNAKDVKGEFVELEVVTDGKLGIANSIQHFTWTGKDGKPMSATLRVTDSLHKVDGQWKIFHSHVSAPVDPTTGKAEMDLKS